MAKNEAIKFMKKTKSDSEGRITLGEKLTFSDFIYNNPNGDGYYQTSTESIYPRIIITKKTDPLFIQDAMDFGMLFCHPLLLLFFLYGLVILKKWHRIPPHLLLFLKFSPAVSEE